MNNLLIVFVLVAGGTIVAADDECMLSPHTHTDWKDMDHECINALRSHIHKEISASLNYMAMGAHFGRDVINRPGLSHFFYEGASEERQHAKKLIDYLLMRGQKLHKDTLLSLEPSKLIWESASDAILDALKLETYVTKKIVKIIEVCEGGKTHDESPNDFHLVDYLANDFLGEQHESKRDLAGKLSTLHKMEKAHGAFAEFLFDRQLLKGKI